jgi:transposase
MRLTTILNRLEKHKSFVSGSGRLEERADGPALVIPIRPRKGSRPVCSGCGRRRRQSDRLGERRFESVPLWGMVVFFADRLRRVDCRRCGVTVERVPWCDGKHRLTTTCRWFLATWAKRLSWTEVATIFRTSWDRVCRSGEHAVAWGLAHRDLRGVTALGIDEVAWKKGPTDLTLVDDITGQAQRLLAVAEHRTEASLEECLSSLGTNVCDEVPSVCRDLGKADWNVIGVRLKRAVHVLDRFHVMQGFSRAIDEIRAEEQRQLKRDGYEPVLKHSRWCLLKRRENLTEKQTVKLSEILKYNLRSVRAHLLREDFQRFWTDCGAGVLDGLRRWLGGTLPGRVDQSREAFAAGADEEGGPHFAQPSGADPELVSDERGDVRGRRGGSQQHGEIGHQKELRLPHTARRKTRSTS